MRCSSIWTTTVFESHDCSPLSFAARSRTVKVPGRAYAWVTTVPVAVVPSPKSQLTVNGRLALHYYGCEGGGRSRQRGWINHNVRNYGVVLLVDFGTRCPERLRVLLC